MQPGKHEKCGRRLVKSPFSVPGRSGDFYFWSFRFHFSTVAGIWPEITFGKQPDPISDLWRVIDETADTCISSYPWKLVLLLGGPYLRQEVLWRCQFAAWQQF